MSTTTASPYVFNKELDAEIIACCLAGEDLMRIALSFRVPLDGVQYLANHATSPSNS